MYVYINSETDLYKVGFYKPDGTWEHESDHKNREDAAKRVVYLNGSLNNQDVCGEKYGFLGEPEIGYMSS